MKAPKGSKGMRLARQRAVRSTLDHLAIGMQLAVNVQAEEVIDCFMRVVTGSR